MRPLGEMPETRSEAVEAQYDSGHLKVPESKEAVVDVGAVSKWYKKLKNGTKKNHCNWSKHFKNREIF